ncbi:MAG: hypothetical protein IT250_13055, partial [Chitinophagaceae bacterium]|nr:hypothetical protein [Chitinophagaceae bacterium]
MRYFASLLLLYFLLLMPSCNPAHQETDNFHSYAISRKPDLQLAAYITAHTLRDQF